MQLFLGKDESRSPTIYACELQLCRRFKIQMKYRRDEVSVAGSGDIICTEKLRCLHAYELKDSNFQMEKRRKGTKGGKDCLISWPRQRSLSS